MMLIKSFDELGRLPKEGDRVKICDYPGDLHWNNRMNKFLSCVMTVREFDTAEHCCKMREDFGDFSGNRTPGWNWYMDVIEGLVIEEIEDILEDPATWTNGASIEALLT